MTDMKTTMTNFRRHGETGAVSVYIDSFDVPNVI